MGWIKSEDGKHLVNLMNVRSISLEYISSVDEEYRIFAEVSDKEAYWMTGPKTKQKAEEIFSRIERWLESGAQGVFQV